MFLEDKEDIRKWFNDHPEAREILKGYRYQHKYPYEIEKRMNKPATEEELYRPLEVEDIKYICTGGWFGETGLFGYYYPLGVPHYVKIGE